MEMAPTCRCRTGSWACFCKLGCPPGRPRRQNAGHAPSRTPIPVMLAQRVRTAGAQVRAAQKASTGSALYGRRDARVHSNPELPQLAIVHRRRRACERVRTARRLGERDHVADGAEAAQLGDDAIEPVGDAAQRWRAVAERLEEKAEALPRFFRTYAQRIEHLLLELWRVDTDRPPADLPAVPDHVVGAAAPGPRVGVEVARRCGERVMERVVALLVLVPFEHGEVEHPEDVVPLRLHVRHLHTEDAE